MSGEQYNETYFLRGKQAGVSLYENYRWLESLTIPMACAMVRHLGIKHDDTILDFGCARGYTVRAFRELNYTAWGLDISKWAIDNCDPAVNDYVMREVGILPSATYDWIIAKDVLEHVQYIDATIESMMSAAQSGVFVVVPLSLVDNGRYVVGSYEKDVTHIHRLTLATWAAKFIRPGWSVEASYRVEGVKDNYKKFEFGNGFLVARRVAR